MTSVLAFLLVLGVLIFIHELGHFVVAKLSGVAVETFSLGFGPRIFSVTRGGTEYRLSILPFGGYVKMFGESPDEEVSESERELSFTHKSLSKRALIVSAGSVMNIVLALVLFPLVFMIGVEVPSYRDMEPRIAYVVPDGASSLAGVKKGDIIKSIDGRAVKTWEDVDIARALHPEGELHMVVDSGGLRREVKFDEGEPLGLAHPMNVVIGAVFKGSAAEEADLQPGDKILAVDGAAVDHWVEFRDIVSEGDVERELSVTRGEGSLTIKLTPRLNKEQGVYMIGIAYMEETVFKRYGFTNSVVHGLEKAKEMTVLLFRVIKGLFAGEYSIKTLGGPVLIAQVAGQAAETGISTLLTFVAFLSLQLGILNLFPIPVLDGGHLMFYLVEAVIRRPLNEKVIGVAQQVGLVMLIALMVLVTWNDILRIFNWG